MRKRLLLESTCICICENTNERICILSCICENSKYLKGIADTIVIACDEIICYGYCIKKSDKY